MNSGSPGFLTKHLQPTAVPNSSTAYNARRFFGVLVMSTEDPRFAGVARLYGVEGLERLRAAHVAVVGIGGVGSWAAEAMARCGVGEISLTVGQPE